MLLKEIHISGFGKYIHRDMSFSEGINVIYGENGSGKSTLHAYLKSMLFGMERGRGRAAGHDAYSHYYPWEGQAAYGGSLTISAGEEDYLIERRLDTKNRSLSVRKPESGQLAAASQEELDALLGHITEETAESGHRRFFKRKPEKPSFQHHLIRYFHTGCNKSLVLSSGEKKGAEAAVEPGSFCQVSGDFRKNL